MRQEILRAVATNEERQVVAHILDMIERCEQGQGVQVSWFLTLSEQDLVSQIMRRFPNLSFAFEGGFPNSERKRLVITAPNYGLENLGDISALRVDVQTGPEGEISHRDILGAAMGLGLNRRFVGDIVLTENGGEMVVASRLAPEISRNLVSVGRFPARCEIIGLDQLSAGLERKKLVKSTVSALRLDAVASAGFGKSRSAMVREIKAMRVRINGSPARSPSQIVKEGDVISVGGKGRIVLAHVGGQTKKNRTVIEVERYY